MENKKEGYTMTATQNFKILEILEPTMGREKATEFTKSIEEIVDAKVQNEAKLLATKEDLQKVSDKIESRVWTTFITLIVMILGLYATIIFKH